MILSEALQTLSPEASFRANSVATLHRDKILPLLPCVAALFIRAAVPFGETRCVLRESGAPERMMRAPARGIMNSWARHRSALR